MGLNATTNGVMPPGSMGGSGGSKPPAATASASQSAKDYDFSSLTQGMFSKPWSVLIRPSYIVYYNSQKKKKKSIFPVSGIVNYL